jgi:hypothetical protein
MRTELDTTAFEPGNIVITDFARRRQYEVVSYDHTHVLVRDVETGRRFTFPTDRLAVVDSAWPFGSIKDYERKGRNMTTISKLAQDSSGSLPQKAKGRPTNQDNLIRRRMKVLKASNPYIEAEPEPEEDPRPSRKDTFDRFMESWRE